MREEKRLKEMNRKEYGKYGKKNRCVREGKGNEGKFEETRPAKRREEGRERKGRGEGGEGSEEKRRGK